jgi:hypothetical protein
MDHEMTERERMLASIVNTIADYRAGEIAQPTPAHVDRWVNQFAQPIQQPILAELEHVLARTYLKRTAVEQFIEMVVKSSKLAGDNPCAFWRGVKFLDIQGGGHSQRDMLALFSSALQKQCGYTTAQCGGATPHAFL